MARRSPGAGSDVIRIRGVERLHGATHRIMPDRIETGTYLCAAAVTGGSVRLTGTSVRLSRRGDRQAHGRRLRGGVRARCDRRSAPARLNAVSLRTAPYPAFPTDMQAQFMAINAVAKGVAMIRETIFENRFMHAVELQRLGADIRIDGNTAVVQGVAAAGRDRDGDRPARASASPGCGRPGGRGETTIERIYHLDRGYERLEKLAALEGGRIALRRAGRRTFRVGARCVSELRHDRPCERAVLHDERAVPVAEGSRPPLFSGSRHGAQGGGSREQPSGPRRAGHVWSSSPAVGRWLGCQVTSSTFRRILPSADFQSIDWPAERPSRGLPAGEKIDTRCARRWRPR